MRLVVRPETHTVVVNQNKVGIYCFGTLRGLLRGWVEVNLGGWFKFPSLEKSR
jgi:hypothetical protein